MILNIWAQIKYGHPSHSICISCKIKETLHENFWDFMVVVKDTYSIIYTSEFIYLINVGLDTIITILCHLEAEL